mmetsp:Transcript_5387/g.11296  ORF Transcript_5387/g.11296 Transcript_5387/m.11296 type:complete len:80 (-) Transcript_5387:950-1189(-)
MYTEPEFKLIKKRKISAECIDLIKRMLKKDKNERISIEDALNHLWFKTQINIKNNLSLTDDDKDQALYSLKSYNKMSRL